MGITNEGSHRFYFEKHSKIDPSSPPYTLFLFFICKKGTENEITFYFRYLVRVSSLGSKYFSTKSFLTTTYKRYKQR